MTESDPSAEAPEPVGYDAALVELNTILAELEGDSVDVDVLASKVARAAQLLRFCRSRINEAQMQVEAIVAELEDLEADDSDDPSNA